MDEPSEEYHPQEAGENELHDRHEKPALNQLPQPWDKKAA